MWTEKKQKDFDDDEDVPADKEAESSIVRFCMPVGFGATCGCGWCYLCFEEEEEGEGDDEEDSIVICQALSPTAGSTYCCQPAQNLNAGEACAHQNAQGVNFQNPGPQHSARA